MGRNKSDEKIRIEAEQYANASVRNLDKLIDHIKRYPEFWKTKRRNTLLKALRVRRENLITALQRGRKPNKPFKL